MAVNVRLHAFDGLRQLPVLLPMQYQSDTVQVLNWPYQWAQFLTSAGATPINSVPQSSPLVRVLRVEVQDGGTIRFEINNATNPPGTITTPVSANSPRLSGVAIFSFSANMIFSFLDASAVAA